MINQLKTLLLLGALSAVLIGIGGALGPQYLCAFTALALLMSLGAYFFSDKIVLAMHHARQVSPEFLKRTHRSTAGTAQELPGSRMIVRTLENTVVTVVGRNSPWPFRLRIVVTARSQYSFMTMGLERVPA